MAAIGDGPERRLDQLPAARVIERVLNRAADEGAAATASDAAIELSDEILLERYVQTHGHRLAH